MIIWSGRCGLIFLIAFGCLVLAEAGVEAAFHDEQYYQAHGWPKLLGFVLGAAIVWLLLPRGEIDSVTGKGVGWSLFRDHDTFFIIPVRYWPAILAALGLIVLFV